MLLATPAPRAHDALATLPACGLADLDTAHVLRPGALTLVDGAASDVLYAWMADAAVQGGEVLVADGGNFTDVYRLAAAARRRALARFPDATRAQLVAHEEAVLERVRLARGFTAHQLQSIVEDILPAEGERECKGERNSDGRRDPDSRSHENPSRVALVVAADLPAMYLDDELSRAEAKTLVARALSSLRRLAARLHVPAVVSNGVLSPRSDHPLRILLDESVDEHVVLRAAPHRGVSIQLPRRGATFLSPGPGRTRLEDFLAPEDAHAPPARPPPRLARRTPGPWVSNGNRMYGKFGEARRREPWAVMAARERQGAA